MSQAAYIQDMLADPTVPDQATGPREVANFYANRNVLLTGGSGFLGRLLTERILRSCPNINQLFLLLRAKKGKTPHERFKELFDDVIFDRLKRERPNFGRKVSLIEGDMMQVGLGLSVEHREQLRATHVVLHGAATVRFDEKLRTAVNINVRGTKELLSLAKEMTNLKAFVHVSTAYANCPRSDIDEKFYPPPMNSEKLLGLLDILDDASLDHLTPVLLGEWPNTYTFTKAVAEDTVRQYRQNLPLCILRPSIVIATAKEPVSGWINNVYGPTGMVVGAAVGLLRTLRCDPDMVADLIPADYVVNAIIVAAWDIAKTQSLNLNSLDGPDIEEPPIYNVVSSCQRPWTWGQFTEYTERYAMAIPSPMCLWYYCFLLHKRAWMHKICVVFLHLVPAAIVDSILWLSGRKPMLWEAYRKIHKFSGVISYFTLQQWRFHNNATLKLAERMTPADRNEFDLDIGSLNWEDYTHHHVRGLRVYLFKDPLDTVPQGRAKYRRLKIAHYTVVWTFGLLCLWLLWALLRTIGLV
ncbi:fatty acyl-CoA reductase wat-like [Athalia rosae]|uniref:fatty acyl-CoA reductase wat-like n=1 Tax=Athalia rosae TaxID=37344 RepID=UPI00203385BB|nr:fatty acyl-CoA reductase wat-like [Athalia rosae]XP_012267650.2 fatty acyl-CoA reductase wat-like [Athalia rosae]XP_012267651.2 fatty acyl-CoA reductase wat-like [Athalia rosae]